MLWGIFNRIWGIVTFIPFARPPPALATTTTTTTTKIHPFPHSTHHHPSSQHPLSRVLLPRGMFELSLLNANSLCFATPLSEGEKGRESGREYLGEKSKYTDDYVNKHTLMINEI